MVSISPIARSLRRTVSRHGFNLVEAAIVLGVVGLVIGGIWVAASTVMENQRLRDTETGIMQTIMNTRNLITEATATSLTGTYLVGGGGANTGIAMGLLPQNWVNAGSAVSPYGGAIDIYLDGSLGSDPVGAGKNIALLRIAPVPKGPCIKLLTAILWRDTRLAATVSPQGMFVSTAVNNSLSWIESACSGSTTANVISFRFPLTPGN